MAVRDWILTTTHLNVYKLCSMEILVEMFLGLEMAVKGFLSTHDEVRNFSGLCMNESYVSKGCNTELLFFL